MAAVHPAERGCWLHSDALFAMSAALRQAISDAQAVWNGTDDAAWELELVVC